MLMDGRMGAVTRERALIGFRTSTLQCLYIFSCLKKEELPLWMGGWVRSQGSEPSFNG